MGVFGTGPQTTIDIVEIAETALEAGAGIAAAISSFNMLSVAQSYYNMYASRRDQYRATFQAPVELAMSNEIAGETYYAPDYQSRGESVGDAHTGPFGGQFADVSGWVTRHAACYGQTRDDKITEQGEMLARIESNVTNNAFRHEDNWAIMQEDERWTKRLNSHAISIKQGALVGSEMADGLGHYEDAMAGLASQLATFSNGAAKAANYRRGQHDAGQYFEGSPTPQITDPVKYLYG